MRNPRALRAAAVMVGALALALGAGAMPAQATQPEFICESFAPNGTDKINTTGDPATVPWTAPDGFLIDGYCVKAGTTKVFVPVDPPQKTVIIDHPLKDSVSHYSVRYVPEPDGEEPGLPIPAGPGSVDECGTANDAIILPDDSDTVTWTKSAIENLAGTATATAVGENEFVDGEKTHVYELTFTDESCEPTLEGSLATGECVADAPWINYDVTLTGETVSKTVSLVITDGTNSTTLVLGDLVNGHLSDKILWPGASVAADGVTPTGWPGWAFVNGQWVETDGNFAWTRGDITATLEVNPELEVALSYPPATPACAAAPPAGGGSGNGLAETGFDGTPFAWTAALLAAAGAGLLVLRRARRVQD